MLVTTTDLPGLSTFQNVYVNNTVTKPLTHSYKNVAFVRFCISSFSTPTTTSSNGFGFDLFGYNSIVDPTTSITFTLGLVPNTTYVSIGIHAILVCDGFDSVVSLVSWNVTGSQGTLAIAPATLPSSNITGVFF